ncbi:receptor-type tyrosine-protein phosphatase U-like [Ostrea edulis]|uniref:receptor-type tyrosine-protein phosphatase U-like n=1 Tax=Ostrea edulis TaxID=37623 RepID=UPI0024AEA412|nr:receptor-type tyrosine-protein phosphatase U-like [Ostrea edulis]
MNIQPLKLLISEIDNFISYTEILSQNKETDQAKEVPGCLTCQQCQSSRAVDGDINTCTRTAPFGVSNPYKWTWWYVDLKKVFSIFSIRIQFRDYGLQYVMRQRGRFVGFSLYVSNTTIKEDGYLCYRNGQELPALDFSRTCVKHGRYVIFYNERLDGTTYPTGYQTVNVLYFLCVTSLGCKESGLYGYNCDLPCPNNCHELRCDILNATCLGCTAGWVGDFCNKSCPAGYYGLQYRSTCTGHCRDNLSCNHNTGQCDYGCDNGWTGTQCSTQCPAESYGPDCVYYCSGQCRSYLPCNRTTGRCDGGCNPGYTGELCDKVCLVGRYGLNCSENCSSGCRSESNHCNHIDGQCEHGCDDGFQGSKCEKTSWSQDVQGQKSYIAAQGPKSKTIVDFWKMVWQEDISVIVCLTNLKEGNKNKCAQYWPNSSDKIKKGNISIRNQKENVYADYVIRHFRLQNSANKAERDVCMFHYTQWPDHGVPEPLALVVFHRHVLKTSVEHPGKYTLVHCSAGIGRTGTCIALDALNNGGEITGKVNIPQYVETMRNNRANMIQGDDQYRVVYLALLESFREKGRSVSTRTFLREFQDHSCYINLGEVANKSPLSAEFQDLLSGRREYTQEDYKTGRQNVSANYTPSVLPVESYMCPLLNTKGKNTYYNAVSLQSFTRNDNFISAQYPLPDYTEDFLRLVKAYYAPTIVSLSPLVEIKSSSLWLPAKNESKTVGAFTTKMTDCTQTTTVTKTSITLHQQGASGMSVCVLECRRWKAESDSSNRRVLLDLVNEARVEERTHPEGRILVLSSDGAKRCGQFLVVFNALEQLTMDTEVDIFTITRQLQIRRPEFISSLEEYQFCYEAIADHLQNSTVYTNC